MTASNGGSTLHLRVTQVRSGIGTKPKHRATLRALGLRGVGRTRILPDSASVRGMVGRVSHLVEVGSAGSEELQVRPARKSDARKARRAAHEAAPKVAKAQKVEKVVKTQKVEKVVKTQKVAKAQKVAKTQKVEKVAKARQTHEVQKTEKAQKVEEDSR
jgi:large subunit ribosomal protein L30